MDASLWQCRYFQMVEDDIDTEQIAVQLFRCFRYHGQRPFKQNHVAVDAVTDELLDVRPRALTGTIGDNRQRPPVQLYGRDPLADVV
jgi:hypothetical protein